MAGAYSQDLRDRVIDAVVRGRMSRRAAAARFGVSESSAIKWVQRFERSGSRAASKMGGYLRPRLEPHREFLEALTSEKAGHHAAGAVRPAARRARREGRHVDDEPLLPPHRRHAQKKTLVAREQDRPDVKRHRMRWRSHQKRVDPSRLVFIDETWTKTNMTRLYGWAPRGRRLVAKVPHGHWKTATFLAALRNDRIEAPCLFDGPINGERFLAYVEQFLVPTLKRNDIVVLDNLGIAQRQGGAKRHQGRGRASPVPAQILARSQSDRAGLRQAQRLRPKGRAPHPRRRLRRHRPTPSQPSRQKNAPTISPSSGYASA